MSTKTRKQCAKCPWKKGADCWTATRKLRGHPAMKQDEFTTAIIASLIGTGSEFEIVAGHEPEIGVEIEVRAGEEPRCDHAIDTIRAALAGYTFRARDEAELQDQVAAALAKQAPSVWIDREVHVPGGRLDILAHVDGVGIALELKLRASSAAVERQAQRYAHVQEIDAVLVVTTSARLAHQLEDYPYPTLGGKPFGVIALRTS